MRKLFSLTLIFILLVSLFGCAQTESPSETTAPATEGIDPNSLSVGYGRVDITPTESVPIGGHKDERFSTQVVDPLYATCIAITDGTGNTLLLYHLDLLAAYTPVIMARSTISRKTGVPGLQIVMCTTHNHSGPKLTDSSAYIQEYNEKMPEWLLEAAEMALADRKSAKMYTTVTHPVGLNFVRHHILADGSKTGWATPANQSAVDHVFDPDNALQLVKFTREGGKDVILMNWQGHPNAASAGKYDIRSDVDAIRRNIEPLLDCHFAYFLGASGNVNSSSYVKSEKQADWYIDNYIDRCKELALQAVAAAENFKEVKTGKIQFLYANYAGTPKDNPNGKSDIPIYAFSFGDVAFVTASYEMFTEIGMYIKKESPYAMTFVSTCTNGRMGYLPATSAFEYDAYEVDSTRFVRGTAELIAQEHINMLKQIYNAQ